MPTAADEESRAPERLADDRGNVTAFVAIFAASVLLMLGLVYDGGKLIEKQREAQNVADAAARAAAQALNEPARRQGDTVLDPGPARRFAAEYVDNAGCDCSISSFHTNGAQATVEITIDYSPLFFPGTFRPIRETGTADLTEGITDPIP